VASLGGGRTVPGDTLQGVSPPGWCHPNEINKSDGYVTAMSKKGRQFFSGKIGVTPSVSAPGVTHPSDATEWQQRQNQGLE